MSTKCGHKDCDNIGFGERDILMKIGWVYDIDRAMWLCPKHGLSAMYSPPEESVKEAPNKHFYVADMFVYETVLDEIELMGEDQFYSSMLTVDVSARTHRNNAGYPASIEFTTNELEWKLGQKIRVTIDIIEED